jgi:hypothetical protein
MKAAIEVLTKAESLFYEGREIANEFEDTLDGAVGQLYRKAVPFALRVLESRPWEESDYREYKDHNPYQSLRNFLRASFMDPEHSRSFAGMQAAIVATIIERGWGIQAVSNIPFKSLWRISSNIKYLNAASQDKILEVARTQSTRFVEAEIASARRNHHVEPNREKLIAGSQTAIESINDYVKEARKQGDKRPPGDIISDAVANTQFDYSIANKAVEEKTLTSKRVAFLLKIMRYLYPQLRGASDMQVFEHIALSWVPALAEQLPTQFENQMRELSFTIQREE